MVQHSHAPLLGLRCLRCIRLQYQHICQPRPAVPDALVCADFCPCDRPLVGSLATVESPRWLIIKNRREYALKTLVKLRGLSQDHPLVQEEFAQMLGHMEVRDSQFGEPSFLSIAKETFLVRPNFRHVQLTIIAYIVAQFSGTNSVTNHLPSKSSREPVPRSTHLDCTESPNSSAQFLCPFCSSTCPAVAKVSLRVLQSR